MVIHSKTIVKSDS